MSGFRFPPVMTVFAAAYDLNTERVVIEDQRSGDMWSEPRDGWTYQCPGDDPKGWHFRHADGRVASVMKNPGPYKTELTPEGEQTVIPGCERNASPKAKQLDLFG